MHPLIIQDLNFLEDQSNQLEISGGGYSPPKISTSVSTSVKVKTNADLYAHVSVKGLNYSVLANTSATSGAAISAAVSGSLGGTTYTSVNTDISF